MATVDVKDAAGSTVAVEKPLAPGRAAATASKPVALSNEDNALLTSLVAGLPAFIAGRELTDPLGQPGVSRQLAASAASSSVALTTTVRRISIFARTSNLRYVIGTGAQTAVATTSHWIASGERLDVAVPASAVIAVIRDTAATVDGALEITELV